MKYFLLGILSLIFFPSSAQTDFATEELTYLYDMNSDVTVDAEAFYESGNQLSVLMHIVLRSGIYTLDDYRIYYTFADSYTRNFEQFVVTDPQKYLVKQVRFNYFFDLKIPNPGGDNFLFVFLQNEKTGERYSIDLDVNPEKRTGNPGIFIWDNELEFKHNRSYLTSVDSLPLVSLVEDSPITLYHYGHEFDPADPPFTERSGESRLMQIDSIFEVMSGEYLSDIPQGLYLAQIDTSSMKGMSFRMMNSPYPRLSKLDDLVGSLVYFTTSKEYAAMTSAADKKAAFDSFWLKIMKTRDKARRTIRFYYERVEQANKLFTTFKEGWKSDKGMVYIIKGPPDVVSRKDDEEIWLYTKTGDVPRMKFQFLKVENIFDPDHWVLIRDRSYSEDWFKSIEHIRKTQ